MDGLMMQMPLLVSSLLVHADRHHGDAEIVSRRVEGDIHRYTYRDAHRRARQLANALEALGIREGDRISSLAWNGHRHFELFYAVAGAGRVMHTVNPRLFAEQVAWIIDDAGARLLFVDLTFMPLVEKIAPLCPKVEHVVVMTDRQHMPASALPGVLCYEELIAAQDDDY